MKALNVDVTQQTLIDLRRIRDDFNVLNWTDLFKIIIDCLTPEVMINLRCLKTQHGAKDWPEFFKLLSEMQMNVDFELIDVDKEHPSQHTAKFILGDFVYQWNGKIVEDVGKTKDILPNRMNLQALTMSAPR